MRLAPLPDALDVARLREQYRASKKAVQAALGGSGASTRGVRGALHRLAALADNSLQTLWEHAGLTGLHALVAVGGYGRGELFPHSDVDVLVLLPDHDDPETDTELKSRIEAFIGSCWDAGLEIGSSA